MIGANNAKTLSLSSDKFCNPLRSLSRLRPTY